MTLHFNHTKHMYRALNNNNNNHTTYTAYLHQNLATDYHFCLCCLTSAFHSVHAQLLARLWAHISFVTAMEWHLRRNTTKYMNLLCSVLVFAIDIRHENMRLNVKWSREGLTIWRDVPSWKNWCPKLSILYGNSIRNLCIVRYCREMESRKAYETTYSIRSQLALTLTQPFARLNKYQLCSSSGRRRLHKFTIKIDQIEVYITAEFFDGSARIKLYILWLIDGCGGGAEPL